MPHDPRRDALYMADIVEASRTIARWIREHGGRWDDDELLRNAVLRQLMIVGEAATCLSDDVRDSLTEIPWRQIRGFRNQAVHAYFSLDWSIVWEVAESNLPQVEAGVMKFLRGHSPDVAERLGDGSDQNPG